MTNYIIANLPIFVAVVGFIASWLIYILASKLEEEE